MSAASRFSNDLRYRNDAHPNQRQLTPGYVLEPVRAALNGIELDPCTEPDNPCGAERFYTASIDGAAEPWDARSIYVNPPYGKARERWVERCIEAAATGSKVILLIPSHTDTRLFQRAAASAAGRFTVTVFHPGESLLAGLHQRTTNPVARWLRDRAAGVRGGEG